MSKTTIIMKGNEEVVKKSLLWIVEIFKKHQVSFQVAGGLAVQAYGSNRKLIDIDLDIPEQDFEKIKPDVLPFITFGPARFRDKNWDLFLMTLNYYGQKIDLSGAYEAKIYNRQTNIWEKLNTYFSRANYINIYGLSLPIIARE